MQKRMLLFILLGTMLFQGKLSAQDFSNKGKDFWVGYGSHASMYETANSQDMILYFTAAENAQVTVQIPATGWARTYNVKAGNITETEPIPKSGANDARLRDEGVSSKGVHITSDKDIVAYTHIYDKSSSGASLLLPTETLGQDYYVLGFTQQALANGPASAYSYCYAIATEDNTTIEVVPSANTQTHAAGVPFTQVLQKGEVLNLLGKPTTSVGSIYNGTDLTGTRIRTVNNANGGCKKIAVFCGSGKLSIIKCNPGGNNSGDNTIQQMFPATSWGNKYITVPTKNMPTNFFRILVSDPATVVKVNGVVSTGLIASRYYEVRMNKAAVIEANRAIVVAQYITTAGQCGNTSLGADGDPEMIYLSPVEQSIPQVTLNSTPHYKITTHYINVVLKTSDIASFRIDNNDQATAFAPVPADPSYSYAQLPVGAGIHTLQSNIGFNAIAYGYGNAESYGYNAGTYVKDIYQYLSVEQPCVNSPSRISVTLPYQTPSLSWDFGNSSLVSPNTAVTLNQPKPDSVFVRNNKTLYVYRLPGTYIFTGTGKFTPKVKANNPTPDGCFGMQEISGEFQIDSRPVSSFQLASTGCVTDALEFTGTAQAFEGVITDYAWNLGGGPVAHGYSVQKKYAAAGTYPISLRVTTGTGCTADTSGMVMVDEVPVAQFTLSDTLCVNHTVTFTSQSTAVSGSIQQWNWNYGNQVQETLTTSQSHPQAFTASGNYTASLTVQTASGCTSQPFIRSFRIGAYPQAAFLLPQGTCINDTARFTDSSYLPDGAVEALQYAWNFGDASTTPGNPGTAATQQAQHRYTQPGQFNVQLTVSTDNRCASSVTQPFTVNGDGVNAQFEILRKDSLCGNEQVVLKNNAVVTEGRLTRMVIYWDTATQPDQIGVDESNPLSGGLYTHQYPEASSHAIKMIAYTGEHCMAMHTQTITPHRLPQVVFNALPGICENAPPVLLRQAMEATGQPGVFTYTGAGISREGLFTPAAAGTGSVNLQAKFTTAAGCVDSATTPIHVWPQPQAAWQAGTPLCVGKNVVYTATAVTGNIAHWQWNTGQPAAAPADAATITTRYDSAGNYAVSLQVVSDSGCTSEVSKQQVALHENPQPAFSMPVVCLPDGRGMFKNESTIPEESKTQLTYRWNFNDPLNPESSTQKNPMHRFAQTGAYKVQLTVTSKAGCDASLTKTFSAIYPQPKAAFDLSDTAVCQGTGIRFTDRSNGVSSAVSSWSWDMGNGRTLTPQNPVYTYPDDGHFTVRLFVYNQQQCVSDTVLRTVLVYPRPQLEAGPGISVLYGSRVQLQPAYTATDAHFKWSPTDYLDNDTLPAPYARPEKDLTYLITLTGVGGCSTQDQLNVKVLHLPEIPNAFSPNNDGINDTWRIQYLEDYPDCLLEVFNRYGQQVYTSRGYARPWKGDYNGRPLGIGTYYYLLDLKNGTRPLSGYVVILQ